MEAIVGCLDAIQDALREHNRSEDTANIDRKSTLTNIERRLSEMRPDDQYTPGANTYKHKGYRQQVLLNILTFSAFAAALIYAFISSRQLKLMRDQMTLDERAWIGLKAVDGVLELDKPFTAGPHYLNTGKTPAIKVVIQAKGTTLPKGEKFVPDWSGSGEPVASGDRAVVILLPNQETSQLVRFTSGVGQSDLDLVNSGEKVVYVYGRVCYSDIFKRPHCRLTRHMGAPGLDSETWETTISVVLRTAI